nr:putative ribonuclease H-like domain-containing protein [Tanacetum cinerariifolium]
MYNVDLKNIVPSGDLTCLFIKATLDESNLWHRRLGHINFKTMNKLVKGNLVRGLPSKVFENNHTCVACKKGKQHRASCKSKLVSSVSQPLQRVLVTKPHNKTPYELLLGRTPSIGFMRPFGCPVTILNTLDPLGKFDGKADEGFLVGHSVSSKAFTVFNSKTRIVQETLHINFLENQPNLAGSGPNWLFDIDTLTQFMNYQPVFVGNQPNSSAGIQGNFYVGKVGKESVSHQQYVLLPLWSNGSKDPHNSDSDVAFADKKNESEVHVSLSCSDKPKKHDEKTKREAKGKSLVDFSTGVRDWSDDFEEFFVNNTNRVNAASAPVTSVGPNSTNSTNNFNVVGPSDNVVSPTFEIGGKSSFVDPSQYLDDPYMPALEDIVYSNDEEDVGAEADFSNLETTPQTRSMTRMVKEQGGLTQINDEDIHTCMFAWFLSQEEPKRVHQALKDPSWIEAMQEELLQFKMQKVWVLVGLPKGKRAIGSKWVFRNKKDERGIVFRNKARLVAHGHTQEEGIYYKEVFALVARIKAIRLFLAYASFMGFMVYQMDVKSAFLYGTIEEEVYVYQPLGFKDPDYLDKVYKVVRAIYGLHQAPRACQDKYVAKILRKFGLIDGKSASTPIDTEKPLLKDPDGEDVDVHIYRQAYLGLWYPKDSPFNLVAYSDSDYAGASLDRKSTTGGCQFLGVETPLYDGMLVPQQVQADVADVKEDEDDDDDAVSVAPTPPSPTPATTPPPPQQKPIPSPPQAQSTQPSSPPQQHPSQPTDISMTLLNKLMKTCATLTQKEVREEEEIQVFRVKEMEEGGEIVELDADEDVTLEDVNAEVKIDANIQGRIAESQAKAYNLDLHHSEKVLSMQDTDEAKPFKVKEVLEVVTATKLITDVVTTVAPITTAAQLEDEQNANINWDDVMEQVKRREKQDNTVMRYQALKRKLVTEAQARKNMMIYLKNMAGFKMNFFKDMTYNDIRPIFEKHYNNIQAFLEKGEKEFEEEGSKKKIVANDDDDVFTEATPLASKNFDREDLETLWMLVKERFESTEPNNFSDDFLLSTLNNLFEKPNIKANL